MNNLYLPVTVTDLGIAVTAGNIPSGIRNFLFLRFTFAPSWEGLPKTLIMSKESLDTIRIPIDGDKVEIPAIYLKNPGTIVISVYGGDRRTVNSANINVVQSGFVNGDLAPPPPPPPPSVFIKSLDGSIEYVRYFDENFQVLTSDGWVTITGSGGSGGVTRHDALSHLGFAESKHKGFVGSEDYDKAMKAVDDTLETLINGMPSPEQLAIIDDIGKSDIALTDVQNVIKKAHEHENADTLGKLSHDGDTLMFNGKNVGGGNGSGCATDVTHIEEAIWGSEDNLHGINDGDYGFGRLDETNRFLFGTDSPAPQGVFVGVIMDDDGQMGVTGSNDPMELLNVGEYWFELDMPNTEFSPTTLTVNDVYRITKAGTPGNIEYESVPFGSSNILQNVVAHLGFAENSRYLYLPNMGTSYISIFWDGTGLQVGVPAPTHNDGWVETTNNRIAEIEGSGGTGGTTDHSKLTQESRDLPDQHPMSAISGLTEAMDNVGTALEDGPADHFVLSTQNSVKRSPLMYDGMAYISDAVNQTSGVDELPTAKAVWDAIVDLERRIGDGIVVPDRAEEFIITIDTRQTNNNPSTSDTFSVPTCREFAFDWEVNWGDGTTENHAGVGAATSPGITHAYSAPGVYNITIKPTDKQQAEWFKAFGFATVSGGSGANVAANRNKIVCPDSPLTVQMVGIRNSMSVNNNCFENFLAGCNGVGFHLGPRFTFGSDWDYVSTVGTMFCRRMFSTCAALQTIPDTFRLPRGIINAGTVLFGEMFMNCTALTYMGQHFNLPQYLSNISASSFTGMFNGCSSLAAMNDIFQLPQGAIATSGSSISNWCAQMFNNCSSLAAMNDIFQAPISAAPINSGSARWYDDTFNGCTNLLVNDVFRFPNITSADAMEAGTGGNVQSVLRRTFNGVTRTQNRTALDVLNQTLTPSAPRNTFGSGFDRTGLHTNWVGS